MHTKGRAQLRVGQMINITHDELRIERRKTTELIVSCFRDLPKVPWNASLPGCPAERPIQLYRTRDAAQYVVHAIDAIGFSSQARVGPA